MPSLASLGHPLIIHSLTNPFSINHHFLGIPIEYFEWERVFVDEIHECLCTTKDELSEAKKNNSDDKSGFHREKNRRAGREFLGITTKDIAQRPLVFRTAIFGLTATPLLDSTNRVIGKLMAVFTVYFYRLFRAFISTPPNDILQSWQI